MVEPDQESVDVFRRGPDGTRILRSYGEGETVDLQSVDARVPMSLIYDRLPPSDPEDA